MNQFHARLGVWLTVMLAHEYITVPVLINLPGFGGEAGEDEDSPFSKEILEDTKRRIVRALTDANTILEQCAKTHGTKRLKLGDPDKTKPTKIVFKTDPDGNSEPDEAARRKDVKSGKKELEKQFKKTAGAGKGLKINVVQGGLEGKVARGRLGEPIVWIKADGLIEKRVGTADELRPRSGPYIVHELLHNAGLRTHTTEDGNVFNRPTDLDKDRKLTKAQCEKLATLFEKIGKKVSNTKQETGFRPTVKKTSYALVTTDEDDRPALVELAVEDSPRATARLTWDDEAAVQRVSRVGLEVAIRDRGTDRTRQVSAVSTIDQTTGGPVAAGMGEADALLSLAGGEIADDADSGGVLEISVPLADAVTEADEVVMTVLVDDAELLSVPLTPAFRQPQLKGLPVTTTVGRSFEIEGDGFEPGNTVRYSLGPVELEPGRANEAGELSETITVKAIDAGDHLFEAVDELGGFDVGIVTVEPESGPRDRRDLVDRLLTQLRGLVSRVVDLVRSLRRGRH